MKDEWKIYENMNEKIIINFYTLALSGWAAMPVQHTLKLLYSNNNGIILI